MNRKNRKYLIGRNVHVLHPVIPDEINYEYALCGASALDKKLTPGAINCEECLAIINFCKGIELE